MFEKLFGGSEFQNRFDKRRKHLLNLGSLEKDCFCTKHLVSLSSAFWLGSFCVKRFRLGCVNISLEFKKQVNSNVQNCFRAVDPRVIFHTRKILPSIHKDAVPITHHSMVAYQYVCRCDSRYVGRTFLRLQDESINTFQNQFEIKKIQPKFFLNVTAKLLPH